MVFDDVDGPEGSKIKATVLFPNDPKRRLEVVWNNDFGAHRHVGDLDQRPIAMDRAEGC